MKPFESHLSEILEEYLVNTPMDIVDLSAWAILEFRNTLRLGPRTVNAILSAIRGFLDYLVRKEIIQCNPIEDIPAVSENAFIPFVFSASQTDQLLGVVQSRIRPDPSCFFADLTTYTAILLLARCGMRLSEPLRLKTGHYIHEEGSIYIEKTKFSKDRLIPLPGEVITHLNNYLSVRRSLMPGDPNPRLLPGKQGNKISQGRVYAAFSNALGHIGIHSPRRVIANTVFGSPTPHSLRHSLAINTLRQIRQRGQSAQAALPVLATFMGHRKYRYTAVYLKVLDAEKRQQLVDFSIKAQKDI
jgi:integrase/recombinase XerD